MIVSDAVALLRKGNPRPRLLEMFGESCLRDATAERSRALRKAGGELKRFEFGGEVMVAL